MGGGSTTKEEVRRKIPAPSVEGGLGEGLAASNGGPEPDFCELTQVVTFDADDAARVAVGTRVRLVAQHLPQVVAAGRVIGFITEPDATAMRNCIEEGFSMRGSVRSFDMATRSGELTISGVSSGG